MMEKIDKEKLAIAAEIIKPFQERLERDKIDWVPKKKRRPTFRLKDAMQVVCDRVVKEIHNPSRLGYQGDRQ